MVDLDEAHVQLAERIAAKIAGAGKQSESPLELSILGGEVPVHPDE